MIGITISPRIPLNIFPFECLSAGYLRIHLRPLGSEEAGEDSACLPRTAALQKTTDRPVQLIKSVVIFQQPAPPLPPTPHPPEMFYGAIKDALMIRYEYSAEWQLISRRRALSAASSAANLAHMTGSSHHSQAIFTRCPLKMIFFLP